MNASTLVGVGILGFALYLWLRPNAQSSLQSQIESIFESSAARAQRLEQEALRQQQLQNQQHAAMAGKATGAATGALGAAGLIGGAVTAGITAGAGILAWGIIDQGWFRGGWEGVTGNPIRDRFIDQFVQIYYPGAGVERQYDAMVRALAEIGIVGSGEPGSSVPNAGQLIKQLYEADSADEMRAAIEAWARVFANKGITIATPTSY